MTNVIVSTDEVAAMLGKAGVHALTPDPSPARGRGEPEIDESMH